MDEFQRQHQAGRFLDKTQKKDKFQKNHRRRTGFFFFLSQEKYRFQLHNRRRTSSRYTKENDGFQIFNTWRWTGSRYAYGEGRILFLPWEKDRVQTFTPYGEGRVLDIFMEKNGFQINHRRRTSSRYSQEEGRDLDIHMEKDCFQLNNRKRTGFRYSYGEGQFLDKPQEKDGFLDKPQEKEIRHGEEQGFDTLWEKEDLQIHHGEQPGFLLHIRRRKGSRYSHGEGRVLDTLKEKNPDS